MPHAHDTGGNLYESPWSADLDYFRSLGLDIHEWGTMRGTHLTDPHGEQPLPTPMYGTTATGLGLAGGGHLGCDLIRLAAGECFSPHTHPGDHLLIVLAGRGTVTWNGRIWPTRPGVVYFVPGEEAHAVGAVDDHVILAVGSPHRPVGSADRQTLVEYRAVAADVGRLACLVCALNGTPEDLRATGCTHAPEDRLEDAHSRVVLLSALPLTGEAERRLEQVAGIGVGELDDAFDVQSMLPANASREDTRKVPSLVPQALELTPGRLVIGVGLTGHLRNGIHETIGRHVLAVNILHPHLWESGDYERMAKLLPAARTMAAGGAPGGQWRQEDLAALLAVT